MQYHCPAILKLVYGENFWTALCNIVVSLHKLKINLYYLCLIYLSVWLYLPTKHISLVCQCISTAIDSSIVAFAWPEVRNKVKQFA